MINSIEELLKGPESRRNYHRDIQYLSFMTQGDIFMDYIDIRNQKIMEKKKRENESESTENSEEKKEALEALNNVGK